MFFSLSNVIEVNKMSIQEIPDYEEYIVNGKKVIRVVTKRLPDGTPQDSSFYFPEGHPYPEKWEQEKSKRTKPLTLHEIKQRQDDRKAKGLPF